MASTLSEPGVDYASRRRELLAVEPPGVARRQHLAALTDHWLCDVFTRASRQLAGASGLALVAVGGYGRRDLAPGSDLDLLLVHSDRRRSADVADIADGIWYPVWDSGVRLDHAVRTLDEARRLADRDLAVLLGLLDARHLAGDPAVAQRLRTCVLSDWRASVRRRLPALRQMWDERGQRSGDLRHDVEPDLKEGRGGLRDLVTLRALSASWLADRPHDGIDNAVTRLGDARDALHQVSGRPGNRLLLQEQDPVAELLGLGDPDDLLRDVGAAAAAVSHAGHLTWRRALQDARPALARRARHARAGRAALTQLGPGLAAADGEVVLTAQADPTDPLLVLRTAARAAQADLPISPSTVDRLVRDASPLPVPWPPDARDLFVELLGSGAGLVTVWDALDQCGLVDRLLPEWAAVRHRPQRNPVHCFSVDRHLVETGVRASALVRGVDRPDLLLISALLHDIGKGAPGDHSAAGAPVAAAVARRIGLPPDDVRIVETLVRHHLLLVESATRRDLDDPATATTVAERVGDPTVLGLLHALTLADAGATGPAAWSDWKAGLVADLVERVAGRLTDAPQPDAPPLTRQERRLVEAGRLAVEVQPTATRAWTVVVAAPDRQGLFAAVAGVLALHRLPVRSAQIRTHHCAGPAGPHMAIDEWTVVPDSDHEPRADLLQGDISRALAGDLDPGARLLARDVARRPPRAASPSPRVDVVSHVSACATVVEVRAADRPGLLYRLGRSLASTGAVVRAARVATFGAEAVDVFYLQDTGGEPLGEAATRDVVALLTEAASDQPSGERI